jgi:hypothetical protein
MIKVSHVKQGDSELPLGVVPIALKLHPLFVRGYEPCNHNCERIAMRSTFVVGSRVHEAILRPASWLAVGRERTVR